MKYYLDITLLPDAEVNLGFIWKNVYQQIHIALVDNKTANGSSAIAVSFPEYGNKKYPLGAKLRLLAKTEEQLNKLDAPKWLNRLTDYSHVTSIKEVSLPVERFVCFKRQQFNTNIERLARRRVKRKSETLEQALKYYKGFEGEESTLPFVNMQSLTEDKKFQLFVNKCLTDKSVSGEFNCYGLSKDQATIPWF
ncbi:MAG: type I-F CRISPR-associated endoribonuclease Cas6/Csy4 [Colwellia sp.]